MKFNSFKKNIIRVIILIFCFSFGNSFVYAKTVSGTLSKTNNTICYVPKNGYVSYDYENDIPDGEFGFVKNVTLMPETWGKTASGNSWTAWNSNSKVALSKISSARITTYTPTAVKYLKSPRKYNVWKYTGKVKLKVVSGSNNYYYTVNLNEEHNTETASYTAKLKRTNKDYTKVSGDNGKTGDAKVTYGTTNTWRLEIVGKKVYLYRITSAKSGSNYTKQKVTLSIEDTEILTDFEKEAKKDDKTMVELSDTLYATVNPKISNAADPVYDYYYVNKDFNCYCPKTTFNLKNSSDTALAYTGDKDALRQSANCLNPYGDGKYKDSEYGIGTSPIVASRYNVARYTLTADRNLNEDTFPGLTKLVGIGYIKPNDSNINNCSLPYAYRIVDNVENNTTLCKITKGTPGSSDSYQYDYCSNLDSKGLYKLFKFVEQ